MIEVSIIDDILDEKFWRVASPSKHMSGHMYRNSPFETDNSCGNCDGARCELCHEIIEPSHLECELAVDILEELLKKHGVPEEDASNIVYDDYCHNRSGDYMFHFPSDFELEEKHKDFYDKLLAKDEEIWNELDSYKAAGLNPILEAEKKRGISFISYDRHLDNQWHLWKGANK